MVGLEAVVLSPEELVDELLLGGVVIVQVVPFGDLLLCRCSLCLSLSLGPGNTDSDKIFKVLSRINFVNTDKILSAPRAILSEARACQKRHFLIFVDFRNPKKFILSSAGINLYFCRPLLEASR